METKRGRYPFPEKGGCGDSPGRETGECRMAEKETRKNAENGNPEDLSIEETFERLEHIIRTLEDGEISLEDSFSYYEAGMQLVKACSGKIDKVEKQILVLNGRETEG